MTEKSIKSAINCKFTPAVKINIFYDDKYTSHHIIFTYCESVINKNIFTASQKQTHLRLMSSMSNPLLSLTDKNDVCNGFIYLTSPSDIENI